MTWTKTLLVMFLALASTAAMAQSSGNAATSEGDMAVSGSLGFSHPFDSDFEGVEPIFTGTFEYYTSDQISWRGMLGFTSFELDVPFFSGDVDVTFVDANFVYGWPNDNLRPYVTGGVGLYDVDFNAPGIGGDDEVEIGVNGGGGLDIYFRPEWAVEIEGLFHGFSGDGPDTFFAATGGIKYRW